MKWRSQNTGINRDQARLEAAVPLSPTETLAIVMVDAINVKRTIIIIIIIAAFV